MYASVAEEPFRISPASPSISTTGSYSFVNHDSATWVRVSGSPPAWIARNPHASGLRQSREAPLVGELDPDALVLRQRDTLAEQSLVALQRQVGQPDLAVGADLGQHLGHVGVDVAVAEGPRHRHAVMPVLDEVQVADPVQVDRRHALPAPLGGGDPLPASAGPARRGAEAAVELPLAVHRADDRVQAHHLLAQPALPAPAERLDHLLEGEDHVHVARLPAQAGAQPPERAGAAGAAEVELCV